MLKAGLTGGIGSGKTTVGKMFAQLGTPVYNADLEARRLMNTSGDLRRAIVQLLGEQAYRNSEADREFIAGKVFGDHALLEQLNALIHPAVKEDFRRWASEQQAAYVIQEAAVLFENGGYENFDRMILVTAPAEIRINRVLERDNSSVEKIRARMAHQWDDAQKEELTDFVIQNLSLEKTRSQVKRIHGELLKIASQAKF